MGENPAKQSFLPALCQPIAVFLLVVFGLLLSLMLSFIRSNLPQFDWQYLGSVSLFIQWVVLLSAAALCAVRPYLADLVLAWQVGLSYVIVLVVVASCAVLAEFTYGSGLNPWFVVEAVAIAAIVFGIACRYFVLQQRYVAEQQAQIQSRLESLQARIQPHFMFNMLNTIASVIATDAEVAEEMALDFAELMRDSTRQPAIVAFAQERQLCERYIRLEQHRFGDRLRVEWQVQGEVGKVQLPNLLLQPLVENAIYHGIQRCPKGGAIRIDAEIITGKLRLTVTNPLAESESNIVGGQHIALDNIRYRLAALYGDKAKFETMTSTTEYIALLELPQ